MEIELSVRLLGEATKKLHKIYKHQQESINHTSTIVSCLIWESILM